MIENKERVICQGFHVLRFKERIEELKMTFGFYDFSKLKEVEDKVIVLEGYTLAMEKTLTELEDIKITIGVDKGNKQDSFGITIQSTMAHLTIATQISAAMMKNFKGSLEKMIKEMHATKLLGYFHNATS